jgi:hypothetical protein
VTTSVEEVTRRCAKRLLDGRNGTFMDCVLDLAFQTVGGEPSKASFNNKSRIFIFARGILVHAASPLLDI